MKRFSVKKVAAAALMCFPLFVAAACSSSAKTELEFFDSNYKYQRLTYAAEIIYADDSGSLDKGKLVTAADSELTLTLSQDGENTNLAVADMALKIIYNGEKGDGYTDADKPVIDTMSSTAKFYGYGADSGVDPFAPVSVEKSASLPSSLLDGTNKDSDGKKDDKKNDKSFKLSFEYPKGDAKTATLKYTGGTLTEEKENTYDFSAKTFKNVYDNEQLFYMAGPLLRRHLKDFETGNEPKLPYSLSLKFSSFQTYASNTMKNKGSPVTAASFAFLADTVDNFKGGRLSINEIEAKLIRLTVQMTSGGSNIGTPLELYYTYAAGAVNNNKTAVSANIPAFTLVGYTYDVKSETGKTLNRTIYTLTGYGTQK